MNNAEATPTEPTSLDERFASITGHWEPVVAASLNGQHVRLAKLLGAFDWHFHADEDEMFLIHKGTLRLEFRDRSVSVGPGEFIVVPRGVEHRPVADEEVECLVFEPAGTVNTGNLRNERTRDLAGG
jgi:mannose-6-phosphate isomerase-like protein (cupin superfamily)